MPFDSVKRSTIGFRSSIGVLTKMKKEYGVANKPITGER
jgi:hypothetical protein